MFATATSASDEALRARTDATSPLDRPSPFTRAGGGVRRRSQSGTRKTEAGEASEAGTRDTEYSYGPRRAETKIVLASPPPYSQNTNGRLSDADRRPKPASTK